MGSYEENRLIVFRKKGGGHGHMVTKERMSVKYCSWLHEVEKLTKMHWGHFQRLADVQYFMHYVTVISKYVHPLHNGNVHNTDGGWKFLAHFNRAEIPTLLNSNAAQIIE